MSTWKQLLIVAAAGALGALARYASYAFGSRFAPEAPYAGTLFVNLLGCLLFGVAYQASEGAPWAGPHFRLAVTTGFLGAFTTFSTFAFDTVQLGQERGIGAAALYVVLQNALGIACLSLGIALGRVGT